MIEKSKNPWQRPDDSITKSVRILLKLRKYLLLFDLQRKSPNIIDMKLSVYLRDVCQSNFINKHHINGVNIQINGQ